MCEFCECGVVIEPGAHQSHQMETNIILDDNLSGLLWLPWFPFRMKSLVKLTLEFSTVLLWTQSGMAEKDPLHHIESLYLLSG